MEFKGWCTSLDPYDDWSDELITTADLKQHTKADLVKMAKRLGVAGSSAMLKDQLINAVAKASKTKANGSAKKPAKKKTAAKTTAKAAPKSRISTRATKSATAKKAVAKKAPAKKSSPASKAKSVKAKAPAASKKVATSPKSKAKAAPAAKAKKAVRSSSKKIAPAAPKKLVAKKKVTKKPKAKPTNPKILKRIRELQLQRDSNKDISFRPTLVKPPGASEPIWEKEPQKDRVALFVRDAFWMHASWDITRQAIDRARAAMAEQWHAARPILRLLRVDDNGTTSTSETVQQDIEIHGGLRDWYIEWTGEPASFRAMIGYLAPTGRFHSVCESNVVRTPAAGSSEAVDEHWADLGADSEKVFALSGGYDAEKETADLQDLLQERVHRTLGAPALAKLGAAADSPFRRKADFYFDMDIELVLYGSTVPDGYLTLNGEPVSLREDGTFVMRLPFPDRRQVLPAVACSRDGSQQRTIVVAVERNTKIMEPLEKEQDTGE